MKTKLLTSLALAVALLIGQPAFAHGNHGGGKGGGRHAVAAVHRGGGGGNRMASLSKSRGHGPRVASGRTFRAPVVRGLASNRGTGRSFGARPSMAFGGSSYNNSRSNGNRGGNGNYTYAFRSHAGWNHDQEYDWHGHHYRWFNNAWFIVDPFPYVYYGPGYTYGPDYSYDTDSVAVQVQQDLAHDGYYQGPIDGVVGPGTRSAIAAYQRDNSLPVTGNISLSLMDSLNGR